ncbi:hypothetical protein BS78_07G080200, partial [Paspalum vaginatum]
MPESIDLNIQIDWDKIEDWNGLAHELAYDMVWVDEDEGKCFFSGDMDFMLCALDAAAVGQGGHEQVQAAAGGSPEVEGESVKKRRYYSDDLKIAISLELLAQTDPPVLHHGVSTQVALKFGVPLRLAQQVWRNGQDYGGIDGVKNKLVRNSGCKRIEIDMEAIKSFPLTERTTFRDLANSLGVQKSTLHNRFKEGYLRRHTNDLKFTLTDENK